jgi:hypothetical protein
MAGAHDDVQVPVESTGTSGTEAYRLLIGGPPITRESPSLFTPRIFARASSRFVFGSNAPPRVGTSRWSCPSATADQSAVVEKSEAKAFVGTGDIVAQDRVSAATDEKGIDRLFHNIAGLMDNNDRPCVRDL